MMATAVAAIRMTGALPSVNVAMAARTSSTSTSLGSAGEYLQGSDARLTSHAARRQTSSMIACWSWNGTTSVYRKFGFTNKSPRIAAASIAMAGGHDQSEWDGASALYATNAEAS